MKFTSLFLFLCLTVVGCKKPSDLEEKLSVTKDSLEYFKTAFKAANYFSIEDNQNARSQFGDVDADVAMQKVQADLYALNKNENGNPILPIALDGEKTFMNKAAVLNHKWIIMDYYKKDLEGSMTEVGELLIEYKFSKNYPTEFFVLSKTIYE